MTNRSARDWFVFFCGAVLACLGILLPVGVVVMVVGLVLRAEDWFSSREIFMILRKRR